MEDVTLKEDYISVIATPTQVDAPTDKTELCTNFVYEFSTNRVEYAESYEWELTPEEAGELDVYDIVIVLTTSDTWTEDFSLKVRAINQCGAADRITPISISSEVVNEIDVDDVQVRLNVTDFNPGIYILKITTDSGTIIRKIVLK